MKTGFVNCSCKRRNPKRTCRAKAKHKMRKAEFTMRCLMWIFSVGLYRESPKRRNPKRIRQKGKKGTDTDSKKWNAKESKFQRIFIQMKWKKKLPEFGFVHAKSACWKMCGRNEVAVRWKAETFLKKWIGKKKWQPLVFVCALSSFSLYIKNLCGRKKGNRTPGRKRRKRKKKKIHENMVSLSWKFLASIKSAGRCFQCLSVVIVSLTAL